MRLIALEEHFRTAALTEALSDVFPEESVQFRRQLEDLGESRLALMDEAGIDLQVLSPGAPSVQAMPAADAMPMARDINDELAAAVAEHPERFAAFATIATPDPEASVEELERAVKHLGFKGAIVHGHTAGRFLDSPEFSGIFECAQALRVPIYLHPAPPPTPVYDCYFGGLPGGSGRALSRAGWGWHAETGLHALRLIVAGVFDRYPEVQVIIGHMGENIPFSLARADRVMTPVATHLQRRVAEYFADNFYVTTSAYFTMPPLQCALSVVGADRMMFSVDYPFSDAAEGVQFLRTAAISPRDREKIAHRNAECLLGL